jgi:hypothetical protein
MAGNLSDPLAATSQNLPLVPIGHPQPGAKSMASKPPGVMAAPNRCRIQAKVLSLEQSAQFPDKWHLKLTILQAEALKGPLFAHVGSQVQAFAFFANAPSFTVNDIITAEAEYLGDAQRGRFQLDSIETLPP